MASNTPGRGSIRINLTTPVRFRALTGRTAQMVAPLFSLRAEAPAVFALYIESALRARASHDLLARSWYRQCWSLVHEVTSALPLEQAQVLRREIRAQRQAAVAEADALDGLAATPRRFSPAAVQNYAETVRSAQLQHRMLGLLRAPIAELVTTATRARFVCRKMENVIGPFNGEAVRGWDVVFSYVARHEAEIASLVAGRRQAIEGGASSRWIGALTEVLSGYRNKIRGLLLEVYIAKLEAWTVMRAAIVDEAERVAHELTQKTGRKWEVRIGTGFRLDAKEAWDDAVLIVQGSRPGDAFPSGFVFAAAQFKNERVVSAIEQILDRDLPREAGRAGRPPRLSFAREDGALESVFLIPTPREVTRPLRFIMNSGGGRIPASHVERLARAKIQVSQAEVDISRRDFDAMADMILETCVAATPSKE